MFDLELLGAETEKKERRREERVVRSSNAWLHKLSLYCGCRMETADPVAQPQRWQRLGKERN